MWRWNGQVRNKLLPSFLCYIKQYKVVTLNDMADETTTTIQCLGFIMDGNRRFARAEGLALPQGHKRGSEVMMQSVRWVRDAGIPHVVYYAFSTENWKRSDEEVGYLMELFREFLRDMKRRLDAEDPELQKEKPVRVRPFGRRADFPEDIQRLMDELESRNEEVEAHTTVWVALSYGGRAEIVDAVNRAVAAGETVTEETFEVLLWTSEMPDPDMIIRTSGEQRLSNFLTWKSVYSELHFITKHWPALTEQDFHEILQEYNSRERRRGK